ncbi:MAG: hypothetical protein GY772_19395 [bacterium]|nr:hypothetical protein [bacterium]
MFWPMEVLKCDAEGMRTMQLRTPAAVFFEHITDPSDWEVVPFRVERGPRGVSLQQSGALTSLARFSIQKPRALSHEDLARLAAHLGLVGARGSRKDVLQSIARSMTDDNDPDFLSRVLRADQEAKKSRVATLLHDTIFEAAFEEMPEDDQREFPELQQEIRQTRARRQALDRQVQATQRKRRAQGKPLPQRRVRQRRAGRGLETVGDTLTQGAPAAADPVAPAVAVVDVAAADPFAPPAPVVDVAAAEPVAPPAAVVDVAAADPVAAPVAVEDVAVVGAEEADAGAGAAPRQPRIPRAMPWGRNRFHLARTYRFGELESITVTCLLHVSEGRRCNKNLSLGAALRFTEEEATQRIKEWCVRGLLIEDGPRARAAHMALQPRSWPHSEVRTVPELDALSSA